MTNEEAQEIFTRLETNLRNLWEGGFPFRIAVRMIIGGADCPDVENLLRRSWRSWNRKHYGEPEDAF